MKNVPRTSGALVSEELAAILIVLNLEVMCHFPLATFEILCLWL